MGSPITNLLRQQSQIAASKQADPSSALAGLDPETQAALLALNGESGVPAAPAQPPAQTMPAQAPPQQNAIMRFLMSLLPSTQSLAPQGQPTPAAPTPEQIAERNKRIAGGQ